MEDILKQYESLINRLDQSEIWLEKNNYTSWEIVRNENPKIHNLRNNIIKEIELIQKTIRR